MLVRIVKMEFQPDKINQFLADFDSVKEQIRNFDGNSFLELYQDQNEAHIFFTYSYWTNEEALNVYRKSDLFTSVWAQTKPLFAAKAQAWSVHKRVSLP